MTSCSDEADLGKSHAGFSTCRTSGYLEKQYCIELIAPHKDNRVKPPTQDGRPLRRYKNRWQIEQLFARLQNYRRLVVRYEFHSTNFLGMLHLARILVLLRRT